MRRLTITLALAIAANAAQAQTRPNTATMACAAAARLVLSQGAIVLGTGGDTFDRFVRDASYCQRGQILRAAFTPSADVRQCFVGWRCYEPESQQR